MKKSMSVLLSLLLITLTVIPAFAASADDEMKVVRAVYSDPSSSGLINVTWVDENGDPVDLTPRSSSSLVRAGASLPAKYDLRDVDGVSYVTSVKDQGYSGTCWTFGCLSALESNYLKSIDSSADIDLSESHLAWFGENSLVPLNDSDTSSGDGKISSDPFYDGGEDLMSIAAFGRGAGAVNEDKFPFDCSTKEKTDEINKNGYPESDRYVRDLSVSDMLTIPLDNASVKTALLNYGALTLSYYSDAYGEEGSPTHLADDMKSYYYDSDKKPDGSAITSNHEVSVVGWDDSYSKTNFLEGHQPSSDGAWLIKNSWGTGYFDNGYMWLSYEDKSIENISAFIADPTPSDNIYLYDGAGYTSFFYQDRVKSGGVANVFTARGSEELTGAAFYTCPGNPSVKYSVDIYTDVPADTVSPVAGYRVAAAHTEGTLAYSGYHTVDLAHSVSLSKGQIFSVVVSLTTTDGSAIELPSEQEYDDDPQVFNSSPCQSFILKWNGWYDTNARLESDSTCVHALTDNDKPYIDIDASSSSAAAGSTLQMKIETFPGDAAVTWSSSDPLIASAGSDGLITAAAEGSAVITGTITVDGTVYTDTFNLTVVPAGTVLPSLSLSSASLTLGEGKSSALTAAVSPDTTPAQTLVWSSSDPAIASVDADGKVTANSAGTARITVTSADGTYKAVCPVTVTTTKLNPTATTGRDNTDLIKFFTHLWAKIVAFFKSIGTFFKQIFTIHK